jgi:hypothetical protein
MKTHKFFSTLLVLSVRAHSTITEHVSRGTRCLGRLFRHPDFADGWPGSLSRPAHHDSVEGYASLCSIFYGM